jgi:hypothetical protein
MNMHAEHAANKLESTPNKIEGAGAWIGEVIQNDSSWIVHWNSEQIAELESAAVHFLKSGVA